MCRPEKPIDWNLVENLSIAGCKGTEMAAQFDMHPKTFYHRIEEKFGMTFTEYCSEKRRKGDALLKQKQFDKAILGDNTMLIFLGKTRLGQVEPDPISYQKKQPIMVNINGDLASGIIISPQDVSEEVDSCIE